MQIVDGNFLHLYLLNKNMHVYTLESQATLVTLYG